MNRRELLRLGLGLTLTSRVISSRACGVEELQVMTVRGPIDPAQLGITLPHEHILVDFIGADRATHGRYDPDEVARVALPHLERVGALGCRTFVECTPAYLARDPELLRRLSEASGLHILTNTGYYAANGGRHLPAHARSESADALAARWLAEWRDGIGATGIRPGFVKIGLDAGPLDAVGRTLVRAAARTHKASGLTIAAHTGDGASTFEQLAVLDEEGVDPSAWIWVHAQNERDADAHFRAGKRGAWVEFDGLAPDSVDRHIALIESMKRNDLLGRVLLSHDAGWYHVGEPGGGSFRSFEMLFTRVLPVLRERGFNDEDIDRLIVANPREAFTIRVRHAGGS